MTIQDDARELLGFIYNQYVNEDGRINPDILLNKFSEWDGKRID